MGRQSKAIQACLKNLQKHVTTPQKAYVEDITDEEDADYNHAKQHGTADLLEEGFFFLDEDSDSDEDSMPFLQRHRQLQSKLHEKCPRAHMQPGDITRVDRECIRQHLARARQSRICIILTTTRQCRGGSKGWNRLYASEVSGLTVGSMRSAKASSAWWVVLPKSGSVRFFEDFHEPRTGPMVRFRQMSEPWTGP